MLSNNKKTIETIADEYKQPCSGFTTDSVKTLLIVKRESLLTKTYPKVQKSILYESLNLHSKQYFESQGFIFQFLKLS